MAPSRKISASKSIPKNKECEFCHETGHSIGTCPDYEREMKENADMLEYMLEHTPWFGEL